MSRALRAVLSSVEHELRLSAASIWEMAIKSNLGKLSLGVPLPQLLTAQCKAIGASTLPVTAEHALVVERLKLGDHRDPFDRLLVAQAIVEDLEIVSSDDRFDEYPIRRVW